MRTAAIIFLFLGVASSLFSQEKTYKVGCIGFYNFENLFDTLDTPDVSDTEFTPNSAKQYGTAIYLEKQRNLSTVVSQMGTELTPDGVAILGVAEIENRKVLEDFAAQEAVKDRNYQIVHYDSPDGRGIDVALLYNPKYYQVLSSRPIPMTAYEEEGQTRGTRDILFVSGLFDGEPLHVLVNHWPSRRGGESATTHLREMAALLCKNVVDSLCAADPKAKVLVMGDLNDDPTNPSVRVVLNAKRKMEQVRECGLFNPMWELHAKGTGTLAYNDAWNLFDQIIASHGLVNKNQSGYRFYQAKVFSKPWMVQKSGHFKGYPLRTWAGDTYLGGYSDHFPVYVFLVKEVGE
ncbi:MAG: endonuclease/exonuclease/phosphatase family protein [Saprospiraceae bacterium]